MNFQLIQDEGHRNAMHVSELEDRMSSWLSADYSAAIFEDGPQCLGYSLWRDEPQHIYIRQFFIQPSHRREGIGSSAMDVLRKEYWQGRRLRLEVLIDNTRAQAFWHSVGFSDYCIAMESTDA
ncbi:MAG: GNAT family N-acetyltransferase [Pseudomonadota bacterium]